ncbi:MAG: hypothetical protein KatS3mg050_0765 [Litorilinea sp.]|nr:MAG: hypothetical protein KatS3mg050_0765 [Litorilinea sp.]
MMVQHMERKLPHLLLFEPDVGGHHADYLDHLLTHWLELTRRAQDGYPPARLSVVTAPAFADQHGDLVRRFSAPTLAWVMLAPQEVDEMRQATGLVQASMARWRLAIRYATRLAADHCLLMYADHHQLPLALQRRAPCPISGIYFRPTFHYEGLTGHRFSWQERLRAWRQWILIRAALANPSLACLFCLDPYAAESLDPHGQQVVHVPDPVRVPSVEEAQVEALKQCLGLESGRQVFLLFGDFRGMDNWRRKGVEPLLAALGLLSPEVARRTAVLLAGRQEPSDEARLTQAVQALCQQLPLQVVNQPGYLPEEQVQALFHLADVVLIPYQRHVGMSGQLVRAAAAGRPVLASDYGLVGALVREHRLGLAVECSEPAALAAALARFVVEGAPPDFEPQVARAWGLAHHGEAFAHRIFSRILGRLEAGSP